MTYYPTLAEDLARAKEILAKGSIDHRRQCPSCGEWCSHFFCGKCERAMPLSVLSEADAAYKLLESFVQEIEEYQRSFALYHNASMALMHAYKSAHPDVPDLVWPDATKVNEWAAAEIERLRTPELTIERVETPPVEYDGLVTTGAGFVRGGIEQLMLENHRLRCENRQLRQELEQAKPLPKRKKSDPALETARDLLNYTVCECGHVEGDHLYDDKPVCKNADDWNGDPCPCEKFRPVDFEVTRVTR